MPSHSTTEVSANTTSKRISDSELFLPNAHEYTICLLGAWAHVKSTAPIDNAQNPTAVHEVPAEFDAPIVQVSSGSGWSCLLCEDGRAYSFGDNTYGQLGQGHDRPHSITPTPMSTPFCLQPRRHIIRMSCGSVHGGFVLDVGELYMFGCGSYGRLGTGNENDTSVPILIRMKWSTLLSTPAGSTNHRKQQSNVVIDENEDSVRFTDISCGDRHTLALAVQVTRGNSDSRGTTTKSKTGIISFGDGMNGRLGLGDERDRHEGALLTTWLAPSSVLGTGIAGNNGYRTPPTITAICAGTTHNLALSATGDVFSWGNGVDGQLGHGTAESEWVPRQLAFFKNLSISALSCGASHSMAVSKTGVVYTWGRGAEGQLGLDLEADSTVDVVDKSVMIPHPVRILKSSTHRVTIRTISAKHNMSIVLDDRDRMFVWGDNSFEQLGFPRSANAEIGTKSFLPKPRLLAYTNLHASKSAPSNAPTSVSRVSSLREIVAAAKPDPIRLGLAHMNAGDRFTMLVFTTKPDDLPISAIPSRESAYYKFMVNYKVYMRPPVVKRAVGDESEDEMDRDLQRPPRRRDRKGSTICRKGSLFAAADTVVPETKNWKTAREDRACATSNSAVHVQGFNSWLEKHQKSPSKTNMTGRSTVHTPRFTAKDEETRSPLAPVLTTQLERKA
ncbi:Regulator of chromosome condensation (RCC1)-like protein [Phytophthora palmivora]|uniref:Regulator of chromosome condensation (RCC1)-like protein n=1 Tax=Phytophthora palmivora TaxID=4796 RepID=A0A2P4YMA6_9STRA|nr:Regulator of chromosome condensation (RCC1)-like protein [Phytophthora palmivora]